MPLVPLQDTQHRRGLMFQRWCQLQLQVALRRPLQTGRNSPELRFVWRHERTVHFRSVLPSLFTPGKRNISVSVCAEKERVNVGINLLYCKTARFNLNVFNFNVTRKERKFLDANEKFAREQILFARSVERLTRKLVFISVVSTYSLQARIVGVPCDHRDS